MNSSPEGPQINFELPQPASPETGNRRQEKGAEAPAAPAEQAGKQAPAPALPVIPDDIPAAEPPIISVPVKDGSSVPAPAVLAHPAQDSDRIEPVWVNKAKEIIAQTHDDPYLQKDQMSKIKADYIMKRFNKQIKTDEA